MNDLLSKTSAIGNGHGELSRLLDGTPTLELPDFQSVVDDAIVSHGNLVGAPQETIRRSRAIGRCLVSATSQMHTELSAEVNDDELDIPDSHTLFKPILLNPEDITKGRAVDILLQSTLAVTKECVTKKAHAATYYLFKIATQDEGVHLIPELRRSRQGYMTRYDLLFSGHEASL